MGEIQHVVFDLGKVLIDWNPENAFRHLIPDSYERQDFLTNICSPEWNLEQDRGRSWQEAEETLIAEYPVYEPLIRAYRRRWWTMIPGPIEENVAIAERLIERKIDVTGLTNWASDTFDEAENIFSILTRMRGITVSGRVGLIKPEPEIYKLHAETYGLDASRTLFFDDSARNVETARQLGWHAEQYISTEQLQTDLKRYGL